MQEDKPSVFIGSSTKALSIATQIQVCLQQVSRPTVWNQGVFGLGWGTLEALLHASENFDFAVLVLTPDDVTISKEVEASSPRDNVIFELGLFMGRLGPKRTFIFYDASVKLKLLSDLAGIGLATFDGDWAAESLAPAIGAACHPIVEAVRKNQDRPVMPQTELIRLLLEVDSAAFTTPLEIEQSLIAFNIRVNQVKTLFAASIKRIDVAYHLYFRAIYEMVSALSNEAGKIWTNSGHSSYITWNGDGIAIDALRYAIVNQVNDLLSALSTTSKIDNSRFITLVRLNYIEGEAVDKAKLIVTHHNLDSRIVDRYIADYTANKNSSTV